MSEEFKALGFKYYVHTHWGRLWSLNFCTWRFVLIHNLCMTLNFFILRRKENGGRRGREEKREREWTKGPNMCFTSYDMKNASHLGSQYLPSLSLFSFVFPPSSLGRFWILFTVLVSVSALCACVCLPSMSFYLFPWPCPQLQVPAQNKSKFHWKANKTFYNWKFLTMVQIICSNPSSLGNWGSERLLNLPNVTKPIDDRNETKIQVFPIKVLKESTESYF